MKRFNWLMIMISGLAVYALAARAAPADNQPESVKTEVIHTEQHSADPITDYTQAKTENNFTGSPINLQLKDADVREVLRMIGDASGFNIIVHPNVQGKISLMLEQVPWDQALDVVLNTLGLAADRNQSVLRVLPRDLFVQEKQTELNAKRLSADAAPRITRIFPISYAELSPLQNVLQNFINSQNRTPGSATSPGIIMTDPNTNSIIVRDIAENVERVKKMIELLDIQTAQVLIEAKVVEASEGFSSSFGGNLGFGDTKWLSGFNGNDPLSSLAGKFSSSTGGTAVGAHGFGFAGSTTTGTQLGIFPGTGVNLRLNAALSMSEQKDMAKVVSSPKLVVISGKSATINQARTAMIPVTTMVNNTPVITFQPISAETKLNVTPRVTNDGSVYLKLDLSRGLLRTPDAGTATVDPRNMNTEVIVDSGGTIVIGGIFSTDETMGESGIPFLRKIPVLGWLFGGETKSSSKIELMFFITPRILNPKKSGLQSTAEG